MPPRNGDEQGMEGAFLKAYKDYAAHVYGHLLNIVHSDADAWDLTQESFVRFLKYLRRNKRVEYPLTFLYRTSSRLALRFLSSKQRNIRPAAKLPELPADSDEWRLETWSLIKSIWNDLAPDTRLVAKVLFIDQLSQREICNYTGLGRGRVRRKIKQIRRLLEKKEKIR